MNKYLAGLVLWAGLGWAPSGRAAEFALADDACVVFLGDVLTEQGTFPDAVEAFVRVAYPSSRARFFRFGQTGATVSRLQQIFAQDVAVLEPKPTHVVVCVGLHLVNMRAVPEDVLEQFRSELETLVRGIQAEKMQVVLMTPPSADLNRNVRLQGLDFNTKTLGPIADVVRETASAYQADLVDWYGVSLREREKRQETDSAFSFSRDGLRPGSEGNALAAALLLERWQADPMEVSITLDWKNGRATADLGRVTAEKLDSGEIKLSFEDFPIPWVLPSGRREPVSAQWYATRLCRFVLRAEELPTSALIVETDRQSLPLVRQQLEAGFNLAASEPLTQAPEAMRLVQLINVKNKLFTQRRLDREAKRPAEQELTKAYETLMEAYRLYHAGYVEMIDKAARRMNFELTLRAVDPADKNAFRRVPRLRTPKVIRQGASEGDADTQEQEQSGEESEEPKKGGLVHPRAPD